MNSLKKKIARLSIQGILLASTTTLVVVMLVVNQLLNSFMKLTDERAQKLVQQIADNAKTNETQVAQLIHDTTLSKMKNIVEHDVPTLRTPFLENSASFIRRFIVDSFHLDPDLLHVSFFSVQNGEIKAWQIASRDLPKGCDPHTHYDKASQSWIVPQPDGTDRKIPDDGLLRGLEAESVSIRELILGSVRAMELMAPVYDMDSMDLASARKSSEPVGYIRYIISLDKMDKLIAAEKEKAENAIQETLKGNAEAKQAITAMGRRFELFGFVIILLVSAGVLAFSIRRSSRNAELLATPVRQLRDAAEQISQGHYEQPITVTSDDEIGQLAETFEDMRGKIREFTSNLQGLVQERTRQISFEKAKMQEILDNIELGIITIDASLRIDAQYAPYMERLFPHKDKLAGASLQDIVLAPMQVDADHKDRIVESLKFIIGQDSLNFFTNASHLPARAEFSVGADATARTFSIDWSPILEDSLVARMMLVIKDLSAELEMQRRVAAAQEENDRLTQTISEVLRSPKERVFAFLRNVRSTTQTLKGQLAQGQRENALIELHTLKGGARTLRLSSLALQLHNAESQLKEGHALGLQDFERWIESYLGIVTKVFGMDSEAAVQALDESCLLSHMAQCVPTLIQHAQEANLQLQSILVQDEVLVWPEPLMDVVRSLLVHALNNAIDHGYAIPIRAGRERRDIAIDLKALRNQNAVKLVIRDYGYGLDLERIRARVRASGLPRHFEENPALSLFEEGFSTATEVSLTSGRGVGLSSIHRKIQELGGQTWIGNAPDASGTQLEITIPFDRVQTAAMPGRAS